MLKKGAKLRVTRRHPAQYSADLGMLRQEQSTDRNQISDTHSRQRTRFTDIRMDDANEEEKE